MTGLSEDSTIGTWRLTLRSLRAEDADEMADVLADPALHEFTGGEPATLEELRVGYASLLEGSGSSTELWLNWIVRRTEDDVAVGTVQATVMDPDAEPIAFVAWIIGSTWQRQGYASEAAVGLVQWLTSQGIESVVAHIHAEHLASGAVATRAGLLPTSEVADGEVVWRLA
ncbi:MAG: GNAT family N-acetyltransferase [Ilumatobacteraceae bacterium]